MWILLRPHYLFYAYLSLIPAFFISHQVVEKSFRFINHVLQTIESFLNGSNFPSSLSVYLFWAVARENIQASKKKQKK